MSTLAVTEITAACNRDYKPARQRQSRSIVLSEGNRRRFPLTLNRSLHREVLNALYFVDTLLIATTSRTTISAPITVQIHIPPLIHPYAWFIIEPLPFGYDQAIPNRSCARGIWLLVGPVLAMCRLSERNGPGRMCPCL
jgi:hypothetical protein